MLFGHGTDADLLKNFDEGICGSNMSKLIQISVNWKFMKEAELLQLIDTGTHFVFSETVLKLTKSKSFFSI